MDAKKPRGPSANAALRELIELLARIAVEDHCASLQDIKTKADKISENDSED